MPRRLSLDTLPDVSPALRPAVAPDRLGIGIVHLGLGAFHRAHQAVFTEEAVAAAGGDWGICGVTLRSAAVVDQLAPQDGLYTVVTRDPDGATARVAGAVREALFAGAHAERVVERLARPGVRVVTLTVTEKGYRHDPATGRLRPDDPGTAADLGGGAPRTVLGLLVRGLQERRRAGGGPLAVLCCDNLPRNGATLAGLVGEFVDRLPSAQAGPLAAWIGENVAFPSTVVDRIVPATTPADRADVARLLGLRDEGVVVTEPFRQWVIEDDFPGGRPRWERAGAQFTDDVAPYEAIKLRMLNGTHSALAYLGALAGCDTIAEVMAHDALVTVARGLLSDDVAPTLRAPAGFDLDAYTGQLLDRFANPALRHRTVQVAMDGSQKLPQRLLTTLRARRAAGAEPRWAALAVAAWMRWVWSEHTDTGAPRRLDDPMADRLRRTIAGCTAPGDVVVRLLGIREIFGDDLIDDAGLRVLLTDALAQLTTAGAARTARALAQAA